MSINELIEWSVKQLTEVVEKGLEKIGITVSKPVLAVICIIFGHIP
jgi:hypothetical protein